MNNVEFCLKELKEFDPKTKDIETLKMNLLTIIELKEAIEYRIKNLNKGKK